MQTGLMVRILETHVHECSVIAKKEPLKGGDPDPEGAGHGAGHGSIRGTCVDMRTEQVTLSEIFRDLDLEVHQEDIGSPHSDSWRIPEHTYKSRGRVRGHDFDPKEWRDRGPVHRQHSGGTARSHLKSFANATESSTRTEKRGRNIIKPCIGAVKSAISWMKDAVTTIADVAKQVVNAAISFPISLMNAANDLTGGKLDFIVKPATQALKTVQTELDKQIDDLAANANRLLDFAALAVEAAGCLAGKFQMKISNYNLQSMSLTKYAGVKAKALVNVYVSVTFDVGVYKELFKKEWDLSFSVGPVKITVVPYFTVGVGLLGDISLTWENNLEASLTAGVELGLKYESGQLKPVAGWMDGKPPEIKLPELKPPSSVYLDVIFQLVPELAVDLGVYGIRFLNLQVPGPVY
eukprot:tig00000254_g22487.t1